MQLIQRIIAALLLLVSAASLYAHAEQAQTVTLLVWVRNSRGAPVDGMRAVDFVVREHGVENRVVALKKFAASQASVPHLHRSNDADRTAQQTNVLLIVTPMSAHSRYAALQQVDRLLSKPFAAVWKLGLVDVEGTLQPFGQSVEQMRSVLQQFAQRSSTKPHQPVLGDSWKFNAVRAIHELGVLPGRHVVICISDYESKSSSSVEQNPTLLRVEPGDFVSAALHAQAALYTLEADGPAVAVPLGEAASPHSYFGSGQNAADSILQQTLALGAMRADLLSAAEETGGQTARDLPDAFRRIADDEAGYYSVTFEAHPNPFEGYLHPVVITARSPHLKVRAPRFYVTPQTLKHGAVLAEMQSALEDPSRRGGFDLRTQAWVFPNQGSVHWAAFAADLHMPQPAALPDALVGLHAVLINQTVDEVVEDWSEERTWKKGRDALSLHWQREAFLYPGSYLLRVTAMDRTTGKVTEATDTFMVWPMLLQAFRFSSIILADACLSQSEQQQDRRNLFDPLRWKNCKLAPSAAAHFGPQDRPQLLLRVYPPDLRHATALTQLNSAYAVVDDVAQKAIHLTVAPDEIRGLTVSGTLPLSDLHLIAGQHNLKIVFLMPGQGTAVHELPLQTSFTIDP